MWWRWEGVWPRKLPRQSRFAFEERGERHERWFKWGIALGTALALIGALAATATGRYLVGRGALKARAAVEGWVGLPPDRAEIDAEWMLRRERGVAQAKRVFREVYAGATPEARRLIDLGGRGPEQWLLRWGNYDRILLLPSAVFLPDEQGRSYRLRPNTRSIWLDNFDLPRGLAGFFLIPDTPELRRKIVGTVASIVPGSAQTTNSWGCRGPEPDVNAPLRGLILGDSFMQGLFIGDDETPPECLRRELQAALGLRVSVLNTGHLGYSPEQCFHALQEYGDRFRPDFVVLSFCSNDFGTLFDPVPDQRDVEEAAYWLEQIRMYCRGRNILQLNTPIPSEGRVIAAAGIGAYPGRSGILQPLCSAYSYNPVEAFVDEQLRLESDVDRRGHQRCLPSPLFNGVIGDGHMSAQGAALWGKVLAARLALLLEVERAQKHRSTEAFSVSR